MLDLIRVSEGSFSGQTLFKNDEYVGPNEIRRNAKLSTSHKYVQRQASAEKTVERKKVAQFPKDELLNIYNN